MMEHRIRIIVGCRILAIMLLSILMVSGLSSSVYALTSAEKSPIKQQAAVLITSLPEGADIYVNGEPVEVDTPARIFVNIGKRKIKLVKSNFEDYETEVRVRFGSVARVHARLEQIPREKKKPDVEKAVFISDFRPGWRCEDANTKAYEYAENRWFRKEYCKHGCEDGKCIEHDFLTFDYKPEKSYTHHERTIYKEKSLEQKELKFMTTECKSTKIKGYRNSDDEWIYEEYCPNGCLNGQCRTNFIAYDYKPHKVYKHPQPQNLFFLSYRNTLPSKERVGKGYVYRKSEASDSE